MPVRTFTASFDPDTTAILAQAYDDAVHDLGLPPQPPANNVASPHYVIAQSIMDAACQGERRLEHLKEVALSALISSAA